MGTLIAIVEICVTEHLKKLDASKRQVYGAIA